MLRKFDNRGWTERMRSGSFYVHEPRYNTQDYGTNEPQDRLLGGHDLLLVELRSKV